MILWLIFEWQWNSDGLLTVCIYITFMNLKGRRRVRVPVSRGSSRAAMEITVCGLHDKSIIYTYTRCCGASRATAETWRMYILFFRCRKNCTLSLRWRIIIFKTIIIYCDKILFYYYYFFSSSFASRWNWFAWLYVYGVDCSKCTARVMLQCSPKMRCLMTDNEASAHTMRVSQIRRIRRGGGGAHGAHFRLRVEFRCVSRESDRTAAATPRAE